MSRPLREPPSWPASSVFWPGPGPGPSHIIQQLYNNKIIIKYIIKYRIIIMIYCPTPGRATHYRDQILPEEPCYIYIYIYMYIYVHTYIYIYITIPYCTMT